ncbi:hypothetical protein Aduo_006279 [Ancylostoma duodenale]
MAKKSNKNKNSSPYWFWFIEVGREQFHRKYGRQYNHDCDDDRALITQLWDPVKEAWDKKVKNRKGDLKGILREFCVEDEEQYDIRARRENGRRDLLDRLRFLDAQKTDFASVVLQFIAVYPYTVAFSSIGDFLVYPAEIALTHFTLANGTSSCWSKLINFDSNLFYGGGVPGWDQSNVVRNATSLDVPLKQSVGVAPQEVWKMLWERRSARAITVCDASQMLMLDRALFFLASTVGESQLAFYKEFISTMVTAQDLVAALALHKANVTRTNLPDTLTGECIDQEFKVGIFC